MKPPFMPTGMFLMTVYGARILLGIISYKEKEINKYSDMMVIGAMENTYVSLYI